MSLTTSVHSGIWPTYTVWRLFMSGGAHCLSTGNMRVYQALLVKNRPKGQSDLPLNRDDWYK